MLPLPGPPRHAYSQMRLAYIITLFLLCQPPFLGIFAVCANAQKQELTLRHFCYIIPYYGGDDINTVYIVCLILATAFGTAFLMLEGKKSRLLCAFLKSAATLIFSVPAYLAFAVSHNVTFLLIAMAITVCALADFVIHFTLIPGLVLFAAAHCLFAPAFIIYGSKIHIAAISFAVFASVCAYALSFAEIPKPIRFAATVYAAVIGVHLSLAVSSAFYGEAFGIVTAVSALLFLASDVMLALGLSKKRPPLWGKVVMLLYYAAHAGFSLACGL